MRRILVCGSRGAFAGVSMGLNVLTGERTIFYPSPESPEEKGKRELHDMLVKMAMGPVAPPMPGDDGKAPVVTSSKLIASLPIPTGMSTGTAASCSRSRVGSVDHDLDSNCDSGVHRGIRVLPISFEAK